MKRNAKTIATELLVLRVQSGDRRAMDELVQLWMPVLYGRCLRQLHQPTDAQDAAQKVWVKVVRGIGRLKDPACFAAWLLRIGHVTCVDHIRKQVRRRQMQERLSESESVNEPANADELDLRTAIARLPQLQQEVLDLYYVIGFSIAEIAHILGIKSGTVKSRLHAARQTLKTTLETGENP